MTERTGQTIARIDLDDHCTGEISEPELQEALKTNADVRDCVLAVLFSKRSDDPEVEDIRIKYSGGALEIIKINGSDAVIKIRTNTQKLLSRLLVDIIRPVKLRETVERAGLMGLLEGSPTMIMMGGHKVPAEEAEFGIEIGDKVTRRLLQQYEHCHWGSGSGDGMMDASFIGSRRAHIEAGRRSEMLVGITTPSVLRYEWPNPRVRSLIVTKIMQGRFEVFARMGSILGSFPGGIGTVHEDMQGIEMATYPGNEEIAPPIHIIERPGGKWTDALRPFLYASFDEREELGNSVRIIKGPADRYAEIAAASIRNVSAYNDDLIMPPELEVRKTAEDDTADGIFNVMQNLIQVTRDMKPWERAAHLDWFFDMMLRLTFNRPEIAEEWVQQGTKVELKKNMDDRIAVELFKFLVALKSRLAVEKIGAEELITAN